MGEDNFKNLIIPLIALSLFGMLILSAVFSIGTYYGKDTTLVTGHALNLTAFNDSVTSIEDHAKDFQGSLEGGTSIWSTIAGVVVEGIFGIGKDMFQMALTPFELMQNVITEILGVPSYFSSVILGIFVIAIIFGLWRLVKIGD